jgi:hypothetical protein
MRAPLPAPLLTAAAALVVGGGVAEAADPWGLEDEQELAVEATVVDLVCELAGDCPADCGGGKRQLGLLTDDGTLLAVVKDNVFFAGAVADLLPHCGRRIMADGLLINDPAMPVYFVQYTRTSAAEEWRPTEAFMEQWRAAHGESDEWWRADPTVREVIADDGVLGIPGLKPEQ